MNLKPLKKEFDQLTAKYHPPCPACAALEALTDEDLRELERYTSGESSVLSPKLVGADWPAPSPWCKRCREVEVLNEQEIDAKLSRLLVKAKAAGA